MDNFLPFCGMCATFLGTRSGVNTMVINHIEVCVCVCVCVGVCVCGRVGGGWLGGVQCRSESDGGKSQNQLRGFR